MNKDELVVTSILTELLGDSLNYYKSNLSDPTKSIINNDPYARARVVIIKLSAEEQEKIFDFLLLVIIDTTSTIFSTIDGSHFPSNIDGDFILKYEGSEIQGSLQDELVSKAEVIGVYK